MSQQRFAERHALRSGLFIALLCVVIGIASSAQSADRTDQAEKKPSVAHYKQKYRFTSDWFTMQIPIWKELLAPYVGKPDLSYLEVGLFQGRSALWVLENVLTHTTATLTGVDININPYLVQNVELSGFGDKVTLLEGPSAEVLRTLPLRSFDIIYVDGSHKADDVLIDAVLSFEVLKDGGVIIFDDYEWETQLPAELRPKLSIDFFLTMFRSRLTVLSKTHQLVVQKRPSPCSQVDRRFCTHLGDYVYEWKKQRLVGPDGREVPLTNAERLVAEMLMRRVRIGETRVSERKGSANNAAFLSLKTKLGGERIFSD